MAPVPPIDAVVISAVSPSSGSGRTSLVANGAVVLASGGLRVLILDLDPQAPSIRTYLQPMWRPERGSEQLGNDEQQDLLGEALADALARFPWETSGGPARRDLPPAARFRPPSQNAAPIDVVEIPLSPMRSGPWTEATQAAASELRQALLKSDYDAVFIDVPAAGGSECVVQLIGALSDELVNCFRFLGRNAVEAADLARRVTAATGRTLRVWPVPTRRPRGGGETARRAMTQVVRAFTDLPPTSALRAEAVVEVPDSGYGYESPLPVFVDDPDADGTPLRAYERVMANLTDGRVERLAALSTSYRARYRRSIGIDAADEPDRYVLVHAPRDRDWADWIIETLEQTCSEIERVCLDEDAPVPAPGTRVLVLWSQRFAGSPANRWLARLAENLDTRPEILVVALDATADNAVHLLLGGAALNRVNLGEATESRARYHLIDALALFDVAEHVGTTPRFPGIDGRLPAVSNLPGRNLAFGGRNEVLEQIRDGLLSNDSVQWIRGPEGLGKSEIAREYGHRFVYDYDVIWWLDATDVQSLRNGLHALAAEKHFGMPEGWATADRSRAALQHLATTTDRTLLIYDNADDPEALGDLITEPTVNGHIIVTTRSDPAAEGPGDHWVRRFTAGDCRDYMRRRLTVVTEAQMGTLSDAVGCLPVAVRLLSDFVRQRSQRIQARGESSVEALEATISEAVDRIREDVTDPESAATDAITGAVLSLVRKGLLDEPLGDLAWAVGEMCAFLSPEHVTMSLLSSRGALEQLALATNRPPDDLLSGSADLHRALRTATRFGLFEIDWRQRALRMHRALQNALRLSMPDDVSRQRRRQVLLALARFAPTDAEGDYPARSANMADLAPHIIPSRAFHSDNPEVRRWVLQHLRWAYRTDEIYAWRSAASWGENVWRRWRGDGEEPDAITLRFGAQLANMHRALGDVDRALELDREVLALQTRESGGPLSPRALMTARGLGGDLRGRGQFEDAHDEDQGTVQGFELTYGPDHPETMMATSNLAVTARLIGDLPRARRVTAELRDRARRVLGDDATFTIRQTVNLAVVLRDLGDYAEAARLLRDARDGVARVHSEPDRLAVQRQQLVVDTRRRLNGRPLIASDDTLLEQFRRMFGDNHTATRACRLNVAFARFLLGHTDTALEEGVKALDGYEAAVKDHPFIHATRVNVAVFRRAAGQIEEAVDDGQRALRALRAELSDRHPWTIDAMLNQAGNLAAAARWAEAAAMAAQADDLYADVFDRLHPRSRLAQHNLREIRTAAERGAYDPSTLWNLGAVDIDIPDT